VRAIGCSTFPAEQIVEAHWTAERRGRERFMTEQPSYSILARHAEAAVLPTCERYGMGVLVWSPLNGGWLTGKYQGSAPTDSRASTNGDHFDFKDDDVRARKLALVDSLVDIAVDEGVSLIHLALGFVLAHSAVTSAIMGPRTHAQLLDQLGAGDVTLSAATLDRIDALVAPGTDVNPDNVGYVAPELLDAALRRR
jgi:aryl-alcohol dehydrogenase-like predicted oxidoreductase